MIVPYHLVRLVVPQKGVLSEILHHRVCHSPLSEESVLVKSANRKCVDVHSDDHDGCCVLHPLLVDCASLLPVNSKVEDS